VSWWRVLFRWLGDELYGLLAGFLPDRGDKDRQ